MYMYTCILREKSTSFLINTINIVLVQHKESTQFAAMSCISQLSEKIQARFPTRYYPQYVQRFLFVADQICGKYTRLNSDLMDFSSDVHLAGNSIAYW